MDHTDIDIQLRIINLLLAGVQENPSEFLADLEIAGEKIRRVRKAVHEQRFSSFTSAAAFDEACRLQKAWSDMYFGSVPKRPIGTRRPRVLPRDLPEPDFVVPSRPPGASRWTAEEQQRFVDELDDVAIRLFAIFGDVPDGARIDGRWIIRTPNDRVYDAARVRKHVLAHANTPEDIVERAWWVVERALALSAGCPLDPERFGELAAAVAPAVPDLFLINQPPAHVAWQGAARLIGKGMLTPRAHGLGDQPGRTLLFLTGQGTYLARTTFNEWQPFSREAGWGDPKQAEAPPTGRAKDGAP